MRTFDSYHFRMNRRGLSKVYSDGIELHFIVNFDSTVAELITICVPEMENEKRLVFKGEKRMDGNERKMLLINYYK